MYKYRINNFVETEGLIEKQREIKDEEEIKNITKACIITDKCFDYITTFIKKGMTEKQIAYEIDKFFIENGAEGVAFETIVASGPNSSKPHAVPTERRITSGDVITIDMGCKYNGYCSDMTRTIFVDNISDEVKNVYDLVLKNQKQTISEMREYANIKRLSSISETDFKVNGYDLIHAVGHGIGLEVHERPIISFKNDTFLKENMVLANEPGIYLPGKYGIRIEDTVLVGKNEGISLTNFPRTYVII